MFVVVVTAVAVVEAVFAVRNVASVFRVFRGDLEGVKNYGVSSGSGDTSNMLTTEDDSEDTFPDTSNSRVVINDAVF